MLRRALVWAFAVLAMRLCVVAHAGTPDHGPPSLDAPSLTYTAGPVWVTNPAVRPIQPVVPRRPADSRALAAPPAH